MSYHSISQTDMLSLTTVILDKKWAFYKMSSVNSKSPSSSSPSFLDITPALQQYLQFIVSFTRHFHPNAKSPFSLHTAITLFFPHYHSFYSYRYIARHALMHSFTLILSSHSNSRDQPKLFFILTIITRFGFTAIMNPIPQSRALSCFSLESFTRRSTNVMDIPCAIQQYFYHLECSRLCLMWKMLPINSNQNMQLLLHRILYWIQVK